MNSDIIDSGIIDVPNAARILNVTPATVYNRIRDGSLEGIRLQGKRMMHVAVKDVQRYQRQLRKIFLYPHVESNPHVVTAVVKRIYANVVRDPAGATHFLIQGNQITEDSMSEVGVSIEVIVILPSRHFELPFNAMQALNGRKVTYSLI